MSTIGSRIRELRKNNGLTLDELAEKAGVTKQTIFKYENEIILNIPSDKIERIAKALNVGPEVIMGWNVPKLGSILGRIAKDNKKIDEDFLTFYITLPDKSKEALLVIANQLKKE